jgi:hypothetical protein
VTISVKSGTAGLGWTRGSFPALPEFIAPVSATATAEETCLQLVPAERVPGGVKPAVVGLGGRVRERRDDQLGVGRSDQADFEHVTELLLVARAITGSIGNLLRG